MRLLPDYFSESSTFVIEAGEATGNLAPILEKIISHLEEKREIRSRVISGMTYPIFVGLVALGVVLFFLFFLLPQIQEMLASLGGELNLMASILIHGSNLVLTIGPFVLIGLLVALGLLRQLNKTEAGGLKIDQALLGVPLFGKILFLSELFQLSSLLATLIWSGIGLTENLRLCEKTIKNRYLRARFRSGRALVNEGKSLPEVLRKYEFMPLMQLDVLEVGEKAGNLGNSLNDVAKTFREELTVRIKAMPTLISGLALGRKPDGSRRRRPPAASTMRRRKRRSCWHRCSAFCSRRPWDSPPSTPSSSRTGWKRGSVPRRRNSSGARRTCCLGGVLLTSEDCPCFLNVVMRRLPRSRSGIRARPAPRLRRWPMPGR